jgi:hypothetical protein
MSRVSPRHGDGLTWGLIPGVFALAAVAGVVAALPDRRVLCGLALAGGVPLFVGAGRPRLIVWVMGAGLLVSPTIWPLLASLGPVDIYVGDALVVVAGAAALARGKGGTRQRIAAVITLITIFGLARSDPAGDISFLRVMEPVIGGLALGLFLPPKYELWNDVRWMLLISIATIPLFGSTAGRWSGLSGGPNYVAVAAAVAVILGMTQRTAIMRVILVGAGLTGLAGARGIAAAIALVCGVAVLSVVRHKVMFFGRPRRISVFWVLMLGCGALFLMPLLRADTSLTLRVHSDQAALFWSAFQKVDPFVGAGWSAVDQATFTYTAMKDLHDVYLDLLAYLGVIGFALFAVLLTLLIRGADPVTRAIVVAVAVWSNTVGAFPGIGWGLLGLATAATISRRRGAEVAAPAGARAAPVAGTPAAGTPAAG